MEYKKEYSENLISIINNFEFTKEEEKVLNESLLKLDGHDAQKVFRDMYIFYLNDMSLSEIANIYDRSTRAIQNIFKKVGLNRDKFEAQRIAAKKRNYTEIRKTFKKTMKERFIENQLFGSKIEEYTRIEFSQILNSILPYDVIVGVNAVMSTGELDIPIIVDAGIGKPSQAMEAMEMGAAACLVNTAIASSEDPINMARAFKMAVEGGRLAYEAKMGRESKFGNASSPLTGFLD